MSQWENEPEHENGLTEIEQMQLEQVLLETAYNNSYFVLTNQISFDDLLEKKFDKGHEAVMAYDPLTGPTQEQLENMIHHYIGFEQYERCAKLQKIMDETYPQTSKA
jgi:hypothetical protein